MDATEKFSKKRAVHAITRQGAPIGAALVALSQRKNKKILNELRKNAAEAIVLAATDIFQNDKQFWWREVRPLVSLGFEGISDEDSLDKYLVVLTKWARDNLTERQAADLQTLLSTTQ
jgi:hypothetical protein